jgi:hypothetical protein
MTDGGFPTFYESVKIVELVEIRGRLFFAG